MVIAFCVVAPPLLNIGVTPEITALARSPIWWPLLQLYSLPTIAMAALLATLTVAVARSKVPARPESRSTRRAMLRA